MGSTLGSFAFGQPKQPKGPSRDAVMNFLAAVIALLVALIPLLLNHALDYRIVLGVALAALLWVWRTHVIAAILWLPNRSADHRFVAVEEPRLMALLERFKVFMSNDDMRGLPNILRSMSFGNPATVNMFTTALALVADWMGCFSEQLRYPCLSPRQLLARCCEFTRIVSEFNRNGVFQVQAGVAASAPPIQEHYIDQLEQFREEFSAYLRELESWSKDVAERGKLRVRENEFFQLSPTPYFERVKAFRRSTQASA